VRNLEFWGCDINPVATLIARVKSSRLDPLAFERYVSLALEKFDHSLAAPPITEAAAARLQYWYTKAQFDNLSRLLNAIYLVTGEAPDYQRALQCAFSSIAKATSQWRVRSTKPSLDPQKTATDVLVAFKHQCQIMGSAWSDLPPTSLRAPEIVTGNITEISSIKEPVDLIITSPPYVTSYEYADLHQLSALWLGFVNDHRDLRPGVIGTIYRRVDLSSALRNLNPVGMHIVFRLFDQNAMLAKAVANYFLDIQVVAKRCFDFLKPGGIAVFVIGNTQLNSVKIDNANHLVESLVGVGFDRVDVTKRRISNKSNTPYRRSDGKFSTDAKDMYIYAEEYILMAHRK
jgi:hypothetical protein